MKIRTAGLDFYSREYLEA